MKAAQIIQTLLSMSMGVIATLLMVFALLFCTTGELGSAKIMLLLSAVMGIFSFATYRAPQ